MRPRDMYQKKKSSLLAFLIWYIDENADRTEARSLRGAARRLRKRELAELVITILEDYREHVLGGRRAAIAHTKRKHRERALRAAARDKETDGSTEGVCDSIRSDGATLSADDNG